MFDAISALRPLNVLFYDRALINLLPANVGRPCYFYLLYFYNLDPLLSCLRTPKSSSSYNPKSSNIFNSGGCSSIYSYDFLLLDLKALVLSDFMEGLFGDIAFFGFISISFYFGFKALTFNWLKGFLLASDGYNFFVALRSLLICKLIWLLTNFKSSKSLPSARFSNV